MNRAAPFLLERTRALELGYSHPTSVTLKKITGGQSWKKIVIILSSPRFDENGNGGPERSGDSPESQQLSSEAVGGFLGWEEGEGPSETPQGQAVSAS